MKWNFKKYNINTFGGALVHLLIACISLLVLSLIYFYAYLPNITHHGESIPIPDVEGLPLTSAQELLKSNDLLFEVNDSSYSDQHPPLTVLKQFPHAGARVKRNRKISISINRISLPTVVMPDILNTSLINAEAVLKGSELRRGKIQRVRGPFPNLVSEIKIKGNKAVPGSSIPKGTVIDLVVMDGKPDTTLIY